jgi:exonuclease I
MNTNEKISDIIFLRDSKKITHEEMLEAIDSALIEFKQKISGKKFIKEALEQLTRSLLYRHRIDPGERSKQYSNAFHDGITIMAKAYQKEILELQEVR